MKRTLLSSAIAATAIATLTACAPMMRTGEGVIRSLTPDSGPLSSIGNYAADVHKKVRGDVLGDNTVIDNDPAKEKAKQQ